MGARMKSTLLVALLAVSCTPPPGASESPLSAASDAYFAASRSGNIAQADSLLADDHLFIGPTGKVQDKSMRVAWLKENQDWLPAVTAEDIQVKQFGSTGRVTGIWIIPDNGKTVRERFLHVWVLRNGRWQMLSHQVTEIPTPSTEQPER